MFIEIQGSWTHGPHPYNEEIDREVFEDWSEKAKASNFYKNALTIWTIKDVEKRNKALENNINFFEFFPISYDKKKWLNEFIEKFKKFC